MQKSMQIDMLTAVTDTMLYEAVINWVSFNN